MNWSGITDLTLSQVYMWRNLNSVGENKISLWFRNIDLPDNMETDTGYTFPPKNIPRFLEFSFDNLSFLFEVAVFV